MALIDRRRFVGGALAGAAASVVAQGEQQKPALPAAAPVSTSKIRQSVSRWCYQKMSLDELCKNSAEIGLVAIDLLQPEEFEVPARYGLISSMGYASAGTINKGLNRLENHAEIEAGLRKFVPLAAKTGTPNVITFSGQRKGMSDEEGARNTVIGLNRVKSIMEDHGVTLVLELLNSKVNHPDYMADHVAWGVKVCEQVDSPKIKLLNDIYHMQIMEGDLIATIQKNAKWMGHFHTGGVPGRHELNDTQEVNWAGVMRGIQATGYTGFVAHEFLPTGDPMTSLREAYRICAV
ncbi:hydroxypyruvate isomerase family protein [Granulicella arctica]|uniref:hydroxypyruvate isomerase family protein n=1 Tax=Granulicella arctica TaxID=940613 RepID=UPI0021E01D92|nr:TIM barrel protein [Granulicella arctica]